MFVNPLPSPVNVPPTSVIPLPVIERDPVNLWVSDNVEPNILLPEWFRIDESSKL